MLEKTMKAEGVVCQPLLAGRDEGGEARVQEGKEVEAGEDRVGAERRVGGEGPRPSEPSEARPLGCECKPLRRGWLDLLPSPIAATCARLSNWIWADLCKSHLIWIKLIFFFQVSRVLKLIFFSPSFCFFFFSFLVSLSDHVTPVRESGGPLPLPGHPHEVPGPLRRGGGGTALHLVSYEGPSSQT